MKIVYILVFVLALVAGYYFVAGPPSRVTDDADTEMMAEEDAVDANEMQHDDNMEMESETEGSVSDSSVEMGSDTGMEFPIVEDEGILEAKVFDLTGFNFGYDVKEIRVKKGDRVTINLSVSDGFHDWVVDEFDAATEKIREGGLTSVTFVADQAGTFEYYCSVGQHRANGMVGTLIVE